MIYWFFYRSTLTVNLIVSLMIGFIAGITVFAVSLITVGLFLAFLYKEVACPHEYCFYYNRGISKIKLVFFCLLVNTVPASLILIIVHYASST
jgi:hypothetical protein